MAFLKRCHIVLNGQYKPEWTPAKVKQWVDRAGGNATFKCRVTDETTHVVLTEKEWKTQGSFVQQVLEARERGQPIHIVSFEWLDECFDKRGLRSENRYSWEHMDKRSMKESRQEAKRLAKMTKQPATTQGLMAQTFLQTTEAHITDHDRKKIAQQNEKDQQARQESEEEVRAKFKEHRERMSIPEQAAIFKRGAKRARNEILSDNHHIYVDKSFFHFDITITKVDWQQNKNERYILTIYESNNKPETYAFNCQFAGTSILPRNDVIVAIGSNLPTALRAFKKVFREKTHIEWDKRFSHEWDRAARENRLGAGGQPVARPAQVRFEDAPFVYHLPKQGPRGELPKDKQSDFIMLEDTPEPESRANGNIASSSIDSPQRKSPNSGRETSDMELPSIEEPEDDPFGYPFEKSSDVSAFDLDQSTNMSEQGFATNREPRGVAPYQEESFLDGYLPEQNQASNQSSYDNPYVPGGAFERTAPTTQSAFAAPLNSHDAFSNNTVNFTQAGEANYGLGSYIDTNFTFDTCPTQNANFTQAAEMAETNLMQMLQQPQTVRPADNVLGKRKDSTLSPEASKRARLDDSTPGASFKDAARSKRIAES